MLVDTTYSNVYVDHMEADLYVPGNVIYNDRSSLKTSNGTGWKIIAGATKELVYKEGTGGDARFSRTIRFTQISRTQIVVSDTYNHCLRLLD